MKKIHIDNIFTIFDNYDDVVYEQDDLQDVYSNDFIVLGSVIKSIENFYLLDKIQRHRYGIHYDEVFDKIQLRYFSQAMKMLDRIDDIDRYSADMVAAEFGTSHVRDILDKMLQVFIIHEHYEKCSKINKFIEIFSTK